VKSLFRDRWPARLGVLLVLVIVSAAACVHVTPSSRLTRSPYLTAVFADRATVNWATDRSDDEASLHWGPAPSCQGHTTPATRIPIKVRHVEEWQWRVDLSHLAPDHQYCYRPFLGDTDLLDVAASPALRTAPVPGDASKFSFAVIGDWGQGSSQESSVLRQIGQSPASFVVTVGDNAYPSGDEDSYGNIGKGAVFARDQLPLIGPRPVFAAQGNHGFLQNLPYLRNFPSDTIARASGGRYRQDEYCCIAPMGAATEDYASAWYAFTWGNARFYVLDSAWADGPADYQADFLAHWNGPVKGCRICGQELTWLRNDLAAHAATPVKFAFFHYPLYSDTSAQPSNPFTSGAAGLEGLLASNGVNVAFSGHAHVYERNVPQVGNLVTYVTGGGGAPLSRISSCSGFDAYALGLESSCRAPIPDTPLDVFHYLLVTVDGGTITVAPTDSGGKPFDLQTYIAQGP